jgi:hypothetical protein
MDCTGRTSDEIAWWEDKTSPPKTVLEKRQKINRGFSYLRMHAKALPSSITYSRGEKRPYRELAALPRDSSEKENPLLGGEGFAGSWQPPRI